MSPSKITALSTLFPRRFYFMPAGSLLEVTRHTTFLPLELRNSGWGPTAVNSSHLRTLPGHNTLLALELWNSEWGPKAANSSQSQTVPRHNTLLLLELWNSGWDPTAVNSSQSWTLPRHTIALLFVPIMDSTNIYRKKHSLIWYWQSSTRIILM